MKETKPTSTTTTQTLRKPATGMGTLFERENLVWMAAGIAVMVLGFILMAGGRSEDPNVFNAREVYSTMRITVAPLLILAGLVVVIFGLFRNGKSKNTEI